MSDSMDMSNSVDMSDCVDSIMKVYSDDIESIESSADNVLVVDKISAERKVIRQS